MNETTDSPLLTLRRDVPAILVPIGIQGQLLKGTTVHITQRLGSHLTVESEGRLYRIDGRYADALGFDRRDQAAGLPTPTTLAEVESAVRDQLATCFDPEIPINILELGLIYRLEVQPSNDGGWQVEIDMTLTAPGCGMGSVITQEVQDKVSSIPGITQVKIQLVWDPPWSLDRMSEAARLQSGLW